MTEPLEEQAPEPSPMEPSSRPAEEEFFAFVPKALVQQDPVRQDRVQPEPIQPEAVQAADDRATSDQIGRAHV